MCNKIRPHLLGVFLFIIAFTVAAAFTGLGNDVSFDSAAWRNASYRERGRMADDLIESRVLVGQSADVVTATLGLPEKPWGNVRQYQIDLGWPFKKPTSYGLQVHVADNVVRELKIVD